MRGKGERPATLPVTTGRRRVSQAPPHLREAFEALVTEEYRVEHEVLGPEALDALAGCSDVMPNVLCDELDLPVGSTYADGVVAYGDMVTYRDMSLSQLLAVAKASEEAGFQLGILHVLCALRGERDALEAIGDEWIPRLRDAVHTVARSRTASGRAEGVLPGAESRQGGSR